MECYQKASSSELFLEEDRLRHCKTALLPGALKRLLCAQGKEKNGVDAVKETVFKKTSKHPYTTDGFYTACKVGCCGGRGAEET